MVSLPMSRVSIMNGPPGPETMVDGVSYLYFGGTSYLGLANHPDIIEAGCRAMRDYGVHSATTRAGYGTNPPVQDVERRAAEFFGTEDAFYFSSGYIANHIMVGALARNADVIVIDESAHYSAREAARLAGLPLATFRSRVPEDLARVTRGQRRVLVLADAVAPATGQLAPVVEYMHVLERQERAILLLDDAHGFGVLGESGRGLLDELGLWRRVNQLDEAGGVSLVVCGTLAKALGGFGGIIPGTRAFVTQARQGSHYFDGASAPPSAVAGATAKALEIVTRDRSLRDRLRANTGRVRRGLESLGLEVRAGAAAQFGLSIGSAKNMRRIHETLKSGGILLPFMEAYSGISPDGILRLGVFANHTEAQLDRLISELGRIM